MASGFFSNDPLPAEARIACRVEYDGTAYSGWQSQPDEHVSTVQDRVESAFATICQQPVRVHCAGRTDTGVHGHCQVIHFDPGVSRSCKAWVVGANANLPPDIRIHWAVPVPAEFHARFSALSRRYCYVIANTPVRPALLLHRAAWARRPLDAAAMHSAAQALPGERDFSAFRAASCQSVSPMRNVEAVTVRRLGDLVVIDIAANAFLHHMVRNIAGALMLVGSGQRPPDWIADLLAAGDRTRGADTAAAEGLYLTGVTYPGHYDLPATPAVPALLWALRGD